VYQREDLEAWRLKYKYLGVYSLDALQEWRNAFDMLDRDGDGYISHADLQKNPNLSIDKEKIFKKYDVDQNNLIDFGEFVEAMFNVDTQRLRGDFVGFDPVDIQLEFDKYAIETGKGKKVINSDGVKRIMSDHEFTVITGQDAERLLGEMDKNKDSIIDMDDFKKWVYASP